jgi:hypothetical protein
MSWPTPNETFRSADNKVHRTEREERQDKAGTVMVKRHHPVAVHRRKRTPAWRIDLVLCIPPLLCLIATTPASAGVNRWTTHGPGAGEVLSLAIDPANHQTVHAGTTGGGQFDLNLG